MPETITTISPCTNQPILTRSSPSDDELSIIASTSAKAYAKYSQTSLSQRQEIISSALNLLLQQKHALAQELTEQMGRPIAYAAKEIETAVARGKYLLNISSASLADTPGTEESGFRRWIRKVPLGPVLIIFAWNYPYLILVNSLIPALLAGDTVIIKPSPQTPTVAEHILSIFTEAGLLEHTIQLVHCANVSSLGTLIHSPDIKLICFTGSVAAGLQVQKIASERIIPVGLELGGKDPAYVRADVNVKWAAEEIVDGAVFNSGQSCCSIERVYAAEGIYDAFVRAVQEVLSGYIIGDPFDAKTNVGPVVSKQAVRTIHAHVQDALEKGAKDVTPQNEAILPAQGNYVRPTILTQVNHDMLVMTEETFGPVIPIMKVTSDAEAVGLMNASQFGLTASIWTTDVDTGENLADQVEAGTVFVNRADYPSPDLAWTGWKNSGKGVTLSKFGFDQFVRLKSYHIKYP